MKIIFFGSSSFSIPSLQACLDEGHRVDLVVSTPDQKKGRGLNLLPTEVSVYAREHSLELICPESLKEDTVYEQLESLECDAFVVSSYGKFIPSRYLSLPRIAPFNVHPSLIPKYRGCAPIHSAILNGDAEAGLSIIEVSKKLDAGDIFFQKSIPTHPRMSTPELEQILMGLSTEGVQTVLRQAEENTLTRQCQVEEDQTYSPKLTKEDGHVSFADSAASIDRKIRGLQPWPGCYIFSNEVKLQLLEALPAEGRGSQAPGTILEIHKDESVDIATGAGELLKVISVQPAGKKPMSAAAYLRGRRLVAGSVIPS